jgi:hypothetical protein
LGTGQLQDSKRRDGTLPLLQRKKDPSTEDFNIACNRKHPPSNLKGKRSKKHRSTAPGNTVELGHGPGTSNVFMRNRIIIRAHRPLHHLLFLK